MTLVSYLFLLYHYSRSAPYFLISLDVVAAKTVIFFSAS